MWFTFCVAYGRICKSIKHATIDNKQEAPKMTRNELEKLIGKYIDYETFELYEKMYSATELTKEDFVKLLNVQAIPEDSRITEQRQDLLNDIDDQNKKLQEAQKELKQWQEWATDENPTSFEQSMARICKHNIAAIKEYLRYLKAELKTLKP